MSDKTLRDIPGIGSVMEQQLNGLGIYKLNEIRGKTAEISRKHFSNLLQKLPSESVEMFTKMVRLLCLRNRYQ